MTRRWSLIVFAGLFACLPIAGTARNHAKPGTGLGPIAFGSPAPDFAFTLDDGATHRLADFAGRPIVVNFWATWCKPCDDELDAFARLGQRFGNGVELVTISNEPRDVTAPALRARGVDAVVVTDPERTIFGRYGVTPIPVTLVLDRAGNVTHVSIGELDWPELESAVEQAGGTPVT